MRYFIRGGVTVSTCGAWNCCNEHVYTDYMEITPEQAAQIDPDVWEIGYTYYPSDIPQDVLDALEDLSTVMEPLADFDLEMR